MNKRTTIHWTLSLCVAVLMISCSKVTIPAFDNFDSQNPLKESRSYKFEAVRALKNILARHEKRAVLQTDKNRPSSKVVMLYKNDKPVCRLYIGEDWIGYQLCDPDNRDWSQPIYENPMDAEDKRVLLLLLRH